MLSKSTIVAYYDDCANALDRSLVFNVEYQHLRGIGNLKIWFTRPALGEDRLLILDAFQACRMEYREEDTYEGSNNYLATFTLPATADADEMLLRRFSVFLNELSLSYPEKLRMSISREYQLLINDEEIGIMHWVSEGVWMRGQLLTHMRAPASKKE